MRRKKFLIPLLLLALLFAACGNRAAQDMAGVEAPMMAPEADFAGEMMEESAAGVAFNRDSTVTQDLPITEGGTQERLIIRTADMSIVVPDTEEAMASIAQMADENGGWVVNSSVFQYDETAKTGNITVRIPAEGFQSFIDAIQLMSVEVTRISTSGQDVTEEFVDLSARLENLEATAARVRNFLDEAKDVEDALAVNQELSRLEGEIEVLKGRLNYLDQSAAYSTVSIDLTPDILSQPIQVGGWRPQGVARDALESLISALQTLIDIAIWLLIFLLPIALIIGIPLWLLIRFIRRRRRQRKEQTAQVQEETNEEEQK
jgi:hypothetical protein